MDYDYRKRGYLLPKGCKDLIDVPKSVAVSPFEITHQVDCFIVIFRMAGLQAGDIDIVFEGGHLRIYRKAPVGPPQESVMAIPPGYDLTKALATYTDDTLRIFVPKC